MAAATKRLLKVVVVVALQDDDEIDDEAAKKKPRKVMPDDDDNCVIERLQNAERMISELDMENNIFLKMSKRLVNKKDKLKAVHRELLRKKDELKAIDEQILKKEDKLKAVNKELVRKAFKLKMGNGSLSPELDKKKSALTLPAVAASPPGNHHYQDGYIEKAKEVARVLATHGESGFESLSSFSEPHVSRTTAPLLVRVLRRLSLIADTEVVAKTTRKGASHCGGVPPIPGLLVGFSDTPKVADPGNAVYAAVIKRLLEEFIFEPGGIVPAGGYWHLCTFNASHLGDVLEAALAAANVAAEAEKGRSELIWPELSGGAHGAADVVTKFLVSTILAEVVLGNQKK
jgi:hypothetical protein